jgi:hypothetical protein
MTDQLESDLRAALRVRAAQVPAGAITRLSALDYHPRTRGVRPPVAIGAVASAAGAGALAVVISLGAGASNAFAGWTATPTLPAPGQLVAANTDCKTQSPIAGLPLKLSDTRGPFTFSVYADSETSATCIKGPSFTAVAGSMSSTPVNVPAGQILLTSTHRSDRAGRFFSFAVGRTGTGVTGVSLTLDDGSTVQATVANGWFVAWWPDEHQVKAADVTTPAGVATQKLDLPTLPPCGSAACGGGGVQGKGGGSVNGSASAFNIGAGSGQSVESFSSAK